MKTLIPPKYSRGFSLLEALIALLVLGFGLLGIAKLQTTFGSNSDIAKQRAEATRLAQQKIEEVRAFDRLETLSGTKAYADIATGTDCVSGDAGDGCGKHFSHLNTRFNRAWTVANYSGTAEYKALSMVVQWTDRDAGARSVDFQTTISKLDPKLSAALKFPPAGSPVKKPKDRNLNVPVPAVPLAEGKSGFTPPGASGVYYVFDNTTGRVTNVCKGALPTAGSEGCSDNPTTAFVISGYINFSTGGGNPCSAFGTTGCSRDSHPVPLNLTLNVDLKCPDGTTPSPGGTCDYPSLYATGTPTKYECSNDGAIQSKSGTYSQSAGSPLTVTITGGHGLLNGMEVYLNFTSGGQSGNSGIYPVTVVDANHFTIDAPDMTSSGNVTLSDPYTVAYTCVVAAYYRGSGQYVWAGKVTLGDTIGTTTSAYSGSPPPYKVCRYSADYNGNGKIDNAEHPAIYGLTAGPGYMSESMENQNFVIIKGTKNCPTDTGYVTVQHQP